MKKYLFMLFLFMPLNVWALEDTLNSKCTIKIGETIQNKINDANYYTYNNYSKDMALDITCEENISYVYIYYNIKPTSGKVNNAQELKGKYLHELTKLDSKTPNINLTFAEDYAIADIYLFNDNIPSWVEKWDTLDKADMVLFSTHADDEQLFFAGLMPTYINEGKDIEVAYFTNHYNNTNRYHELLEGLWAIGITHYPEVSTFPDAYSESLEEALTNLNAAGYTEDDAILYMSRIIRKYKPAVIVGHDENGEYSHGQHILNTHVLKQAYQKANDPAYDEETVKTYGVHGVNKIYLHLYEQNPLVLNYDVPLEKYDGKTAYEVSKMGFAKHLSQQNTWFTDWFNGPNKEFTKASQIDSYIPDSLKALGPFTPCNYGLFFTNVGLDTGKNDMFENIKEENKKDDRSGKENAKEEKGSFLEKLKSLKNKDMYLGIGLILIAFIGFSIIAIQRRK